MLYKQKSEIRCRPEAAGPGADFRAPGGVWQRSANKNALFLFR